MTNDEKINKEVEARIYDVLDKLIDALDSLTMEEIQVEITKYQKEHPFDCVSWDTSKISRNLIKPLFYKAVNVILSKQK